MEQTLLIWVVIIPDLKRIAFDVVCQREMSNLGYIEPLLLMTILVLC